MEILSIYSIDQDDQQIHLYCWYILQLMLKEILQKVEL